MATSSELFDWQVRYLAIYRFYGYVAVQSVHYQRAGFSMSDNSFRQTVHTHRASVHQAAKLVAALLRVVEVTAGLAESNDSLPPGL